MPKYSRYPAINLGAEHLAMGYLLRRNIMAYKAPPNNEGYDLVCIHPDPRKVAKQVRVQVKSRMATDSDRSVLVKPRTVDAFDFLIVVYLNIGYFLGMAKRHPLRAGDREPELFVLPQAFVASHMSKSSSWGKLPLRGHDLSPFEGRNGIEQIARNSYPVKSSDVA